MSEKENSGSDMELSTEEIERRDFLKKAGRYAAITPPAITALLVTSMNSDAIASSGGRTMTSGGSGGGKTSIDSGTHTVRGNVVRR